MRACNALYGNAGNNLLDGGAGADAMSGGAGNDIYFVDNAGDSVFENAGEGTDVVFSSAHFGLSANVETLVLQGSADLQGYGNSEANTLYGNTGKQLCSTARAVPTSCSAAPAMTSTSSTTSATSYSRTSTRVPMRCFPRSTTR